MSTDPGMRRLVLGTMLAAFPGYAPPAWATTLVAEGLAGHVLFGYNVDTPGQIAELTAALRAARADVIVAIDEEGGDVTRLGHRTGSPYPGNAALGAVDDVALTQQVYRAIGADLAAVGVTLDLAPTVDVNTAVENPVIGTRSFSDEPKRVAAHAAAAVTGLQDAGVAACAKHFPGHGATTTDSHHTLPTVDVPLSVLRERDLPPFSAAIAARTRAVMTAHIRVPALTGDRPATFSPEILIGLLRDELGFDGVLVTDALEMRGASDQAGGVPRAAVAALRAGADLLCLGSVVDADLVSRTVAAITAAIAAGELPLARLEEAAARTAALAAWSTTAAATATRGTTSTGTATGKTAAHPDTALGNAAAHPDTALGNAAARRAVRVDGDPATPPDALIVQLESAYSMAAGRVPWGLAPHLPATADILRAVAGETEPADVLTRAAGRPVAILARDIPRLPGAGELVDAICAGAPTVVVEMGWPSAWRPARARGYVRTFGASLANGHAAAETLGLLPPGC